MPSDLKPRTRSKKVANFRLYGLIGFGLFAVYLLYFISNSPSRSQAVLEKYESATAALSHGRPSNPKAKSEAHLSTSDDEETHALVHALQAEADEGITLKPKSVQKVATMGRPKNEAYDPADSLSVLFESYPMIVFSKTYCPYSKNAKKVLEFYDIRPRPLIYELDVEEHGADLQAELGKVTGRKTVPNIVINSHSLGGCDELAALDKADELVRTGARTNKSKN